MDVSVCEWISGIGVDFQFPPGVGSFRLGVYQDTKNYPTKKLAETDRFSPVGGSTATPLLHAVEVHCDDSGAPVTPLWLCVMTTANGYIVAGESSVPGDVVQMWELPDQIDAGVCGGLPDPWPPASASSPSSTVPSTPLIYPWIVAHR